MKKDIKNQMATVAAQLALQELLLHPQEELFRNLDIATISGSLTVIGETNLADTTIGGELQVGLLHFDDMKAEISSLTGLVTINSDLAVMGDATVSGKLSVQKGIELKDEDTGETYCIKVKSGVATTTKGICE